MLAGSPKLTMLKRLKNSARNCRSHQFAAAARSERRIFDQRKIEIVKGRPAKRISAERSKTPVWAGTARH